MLTRVPGKLLRPLRRIRLHRRRWKSSSTASPTTRSTGSEVLRDFWRDFIAAVDDIKELRVTQVIDALDEMLAPHLFPPRADGTDPRKCPNCDNGRLSLKLGRFGGFIGCSNYPECRFTRQLSAGNDGDGDGGMRKLGEDPETGLEVTRALRAASAPMCSSVKPQDETASEKPKRAGLPKGVSPDEIDLDRALGLLSLPREVGRHPDDGEPIIAGIGRFGPYVQHGKTYANLDAGDDVLTDRPQPRGDADRGEEGARPAQGPALRRRSGPRARRASATRAARSWSRTAATAPMSATTASMPPCPRQDARGDHARQACRLLDARAAKRRRQARRRPAKRPPTRKRRGARRLRPPNPIRRRRNRQALPAPRRTKAPKAKPAKCPSPRRDRRPKPRWPRKAKGTAVDPGGLARP